MCRSLSRLGADATLVGTYPTATCGPSAHHPEPDKAPRPRRRFRLWPRRR